MYNELLTREYTRIKMRQAQEHAEKARLLASLEENSPPKVEQSLVRLFSVRLSTVLLLFNFRVEQAGSGNES